MANAPVPGTPKSSGAPKKAPSQTLIVTGKGSNAKALDGHPSQPARAPQPASAATTGPKIAKQSVDYDKNQGSRVSGQGDGGPISVSNEQQQEKKRR